MKNKRLFWSVTNLMFNFDISLFMLNKWITITSYLDSSHVSVECQCMHTYMSLLSFLVRRTKVALRTGRRWMYEQKAYTHDTNSCKQDWFVLTLFIFKAPNYVLARTLRVFSFFGRFVWNTDIELKTTANFFGVHDYTQGLTLSL